MSAGKKLPVNRLVLDSSALLAFLHREPGAEVVAEALDRAVISAVNLAEVATKLTERGVSLGHIQHLVSALKVGVIDFDNVLSYRVAALRASTKDAGLSLGDRACLATAQSLGATALTTDRSWTRVNVGVEIQVIR